MGECGEEGKVKRSQHAPQRWVRDWEGMAEPEVQSGLRTTIKQQNFEVTAQTIFFKLRSQL